MASKYQTWAILVPGASLFRNMLLDTAMKRALTPILGSFRKMIILDVGCGVGRWSRVMSHQNSVVGVDASVSMIRLARNSCRNGDCSFVVADASFLPFRKSMFDLVVSITVLQHLISAQRFSMAIAEIARCSGSEALVAEEMWSDREIMLKVYCPTRILPAEFYVLGLSTSGLRTYCLRGITFAPLAIRLTQLFGSAPRGFEGTISLKLRTSRIVSRLVHFALGVGVISALLSPRGDHDPRLSLHTIIYAKKNKPDRSNLQENVRRMNKPGTWSV